MIIVPSIPLLRGSRGLLGCGPQRQVRLETIQKLCEGASHAQCRLPSREIGGAVRGGWRSRTYSIIPPSEEERNREG